MAEMQGKPSQWFLLLLGDRLQRNQLWQRCGESQASCSRCCLGTGYNATNYGRDVGKVQPVVLAACLAQMGRGDGLIYYFTGENTRFAGMAALKKKLMMPGLTDI